MSPERATAKVKGDVLRYLADHGSEIDIVECAEELRLKEAQVKRAGKLEEE